MTIASWPISERPREKLFQHGTQALSDAEILSILFRTGSRGKTALDLARELLQEYGSLKKLCDAEASHLLQKHGLGKAKYALLKAALALGKRYQTEELPKGTQLKDSESTKRFLSDRLKHHTREVFATLFLDNQNRVICFEELFLGSLTEACVYPREVVKRALAHNAAKVILAHNHPSGDPTPSESDQALTSQLLHALALVDIPIIDHIVIGHQTCISFAESGMMGGFATNTCF